MPPQRPVPTKHWLRTCVAAAWCFGLLLLAATAVASDSAAAEALFEEGRRLMTAKDYDGACAKFEASMQAEPSGGTALNLARCNELRGRSATAWASYKQAARLFRRSDEPKREAFARTQAEKLEPHLSRLTIEAEPTQGLTVTRNGEPVAAAVLHTAIPVDPGEHAIEATAPGHQPWSGTVTVAGAGASATIQIPALEPLPDGDRTDDGQPHRGDMPDESGADPLLVGGVVLVGVGGAAIIGGSILGGIVLAEADAAREDHCPDNQCSEEGIEAKESAEAKALGADLLIGLGSAAAAAGLVLVIISTVSEPDTEPAARLLPLVGPTQAGLGAIVSF